MKRKVIALIDGQLFVAEWLVIVDYARPGASPVERVCSIASNYIDGGRPIPDGFKMKRHNIGPGKVQLRVAVALWGGEALLCRGYVKSSPATDKREMAKFKDHFRQITLGTYSRRGII